MLPILSHCFKVERALDQKSGADLWGDLGQVPLLCYSFLNSKGSVKNKTKQKTLPCLPHSADVKSKGDGNCPSVLNGDKASVT